MFHHFLTHTTIERSTYASCCWSSCPGHLFPARVPRLGSGSMVNMHPDAARVPGTDWLHQPWDRATAQRSTALQLGK